jgi:phage repressor protein C with HTH and peptisase S24 domain
MSVDSSEVRAPFPQNKRISPLFASGKIRLAAELFAADISAMTETNDSWLTQRIKKRLAFLGKRPTPASNEADLGKDFIGDIFRGRKEGVYGDNAQALARVLKVPVEYLTNPDFEWDEVEPKDAPGADLVTIKQLDVRYGMGGGAIYDAPVEATPMEFSRAWIRQFTHSPPNDILWASGFGDSMYPTIGNNDVVMIDTSQRTARIRDQIWAINQYGQGMIKRLRATAEGYEILSDNPQVPPSIAADGSMEIVGRVIAVVKRL